MHHVLIPIDPLCAMPIAGRQMIQLALAGLGEVLALYPVEGSHEPIVQIDAALASDKSAEQIRAKCSIPTIALNPKVTLLRVQALSNQLPPAAVTTHKVTRCQRPIRNWQPRRRPYSRNRRRAEQVSQMPRQHQPAVTRRQLYPAAPTICYAWMRNVLIVCSISWVSLS